MGIALVAEDNLGIGSQNRNSGLKEKVEKNQSEHSQMRATPVLLAASATALETAGATLGSKAFGIM